RNLFYRAGGAGVLPVGFRLRTQNQDSTDRAHASHCHDATVGSRERRAPFGRFSGIRGPASILMPGYLSPRDGLPIMKGSPTQQRLLIFVIAYYAESTLRKVLERIPSTIFEQYDCEVLVVDDGSEDRTFAIGREYKEHHPEIRMTVLRNEYNQGYGGNQKVGYTYAVAEGFDFVAMLHGDGQYAPEELPRLMEPLRLGVADAVFGSRMIDRFAAL